MSWLGPETQTAVLNQLDKEKETHKFILSAHYSQNDEIAIAQAKKFIAKFLSQGSGGTHTFLGTVHKRKGKKEKE
jgi:hypothetical protein